MNNLSTGMKNVPNSRKRSGFLKVIGILCILGIYYSSSFWPDNPQTESTLSKEITRKIQKIKDAGEPTTIEELVSHIPDSENGALVYNQAFQLQRELNSRYKKEWRYFPYDGKVKWSKTPESEKEKVRNLLLNDPDFTKFYQLLEKASGMKCRFLEKKDYQEGTWIKLSHLALLRSCARMLAARADIRAEKGDIDNALRDCFTCLKISDSLSEEPLLLSGLVKIAIDTIALTRMEETMKKGDAKPETYQALTKEVMVIRALNDKIMYRCLLGERVVYGMTEFARVKKMNLESLIRLFDEHKNRHRIVEFIRKDPVGFVENNEMIYLKAMAKWITLSKKPYWETRKEFPGFEKELSERPDEFAGLVKLLAPNYSQAFTLEARIDAQLDNAEIALACHLYKAKHKDYPTSLKELSPEYLPELPLDPFTGKDYIYREKDKGFIVYSLGDNLKDDGGTPQFSGKGRQGNFDIVWEE